MPSRLWRGMDFVQVGSQASAPEKDSEFGLEKSVGRESLSYLIQYLASAPTKCFGVRNIAGIGVCVPCPNPEWPANTRFPVGSKGLYERFCFRLKKELPKQEGDLYRLELRHKI